MSCEQVSAFDEAVSAKDAEIDSLKARIAELEASCLAPVTHPTHLPDVELSHPVPVCTMPASYSSPHSDHTTSRAGLARSTPRRGKAPPVSEFTSEDPDCTLDDWLPSLERAITWNAWTEEEQTIQLTGHLKSRALQEWNLLQPEDRASFNKAVDALRARLDFGSKALAAQDFRHATQRDRESVSDFVGHLERLFRIAYGRELMSVETKDMLLYGQFQEGLHLQLMRSPAVSGAKNYQELLVVARNEERRLADLRRRQEYARSNSSQPKTKSVAPNLKAKLPQSNPEHQPPVSESGVGKQTERKCYYCRKPGHLLHQCLLRKIREGGNQPLRGSSSAKQVVTEPASSGHGGSAPTSSASKEPPSQSVGDTCPAEDADRASQSSNTNPLSLLFSESEDEGDVRRVMVADQGSRPQLARVEIQGVPADGVVDTAADITIMGGKLFALVATSAQLRKKDFMTPDRVPKTYDRKAFHLDGRMELEISFHGKTMRTMVYVKMDAPDQLLLSEGVCRQLEIVTYHRSLHQVEQHQISAEDTLVRELPTSEGTTLVPCVRVSLVQSLKLLPSQSVVVPVRVEGEFEPACQTMFAEGCNGLERDTGLILEEAVLLRPEKGLTHLVVTNLSGFTTTVPAGTTVGVAEPVEMLSTDDDSGITDDTSVRTLSSSTVGWRKKRLFEKLRFKEASEAEEEQLKEFLTEHHSVFRLEDGERGEMDLITMGIDTGQLDNPHVACHLLSAGKWLSSFMTCNRMESSSHPPHPGQVLY